MINYFLIHCFMESSEAWEQEVVGLYNSCYVHDGWECVVTWLTHVYVVVWVHGFIADLTPQDLCGSVGDYLVRVHIRLRAWTRLPDHQWKLVVPLPWYHFVCSLNYSIWYLLVQSESPIHYCCTFLQYPEASDNWDWHHVKIPANIKVFQRPLSLSTPKLIRGDFNWTKWIILLSERLILFLHTLNYLLILLINIIWDLYLYFSTSFILGPIRNWNCYI